MGTQRKLTAGEIALARTAFGDKIAYGGVKIVDGPGMSFAAQFAFMRGNPAITLGDTIHFKQGYSDDFAQAGIAHRKSFMHEMMHVLQYQTLGQAPFIFRYTKELKDAGFKPNDMYKYKPGETRFGSAMLEAQAEMIGDYSEALWSGNAGKMALLANNLAASGLYGL